MPDNSLSPIVPLDDPARPDFLSLLDSDPDAAFANFYAFAINSLRKPLPEPMRMAGPDTQCDLLHEVIYHCVKDNFAVLRRYTPGNQPFGAWLYVVAHHKSLDILKRANLRQQHEDSLIPADPDPNPDAQRLVGLVRLLLLALGDHCQRLLQMAADEFTPKEMVLVLGLPETDNKKVSDQLRECRKQLRRRLEQEGVDLDEWV